MIMIILDVEIYQIVESRTNMILKCLIGQPTSRFSQSDEALNKAEQNCVCEIKLLVFFFMVMWDEIERLFLSGYVNHIYNPGQ